MSVIDHPISTEKVLRLMESENKLVFVVEKSATKKTIKEFVEKRFKVKVDSVNTVNSVSGEKRAIVKFNKENPAIDIATELGLM